MAQNTMTRFLIAGAGGRHGATGNHVVRQLLDRKFPVRALVFAPINVPSSSRRWVPRSLWET